MSQVQNLQQPRKDLVNTKSFFLFTRDKLVSYRTKNAAAAKGLSLMTIKEQKMFLRKKAKAELQKYSEDLELKKECTKSCAKFFLESEIYKKSEHIFAYMAMIDEIDLTPVFEAALKDGKKLYFPRMISDSNDMEFYLIDNLDETFSKDNKYGILEPGLDKIKIEKNEIKDKSVFLVPGLAFNLFGHRLGRGKGYYDKYLSQINNKSAVFCGVCITNVITRAIPVEENDFAMNYLLTESGFIPVGEIYHVW